MSKTRRSRVHAAETDGGGPAVKTRPHSTVATHGVPAGRLVSLDALRGFNMFWIIGGAELVAAIAKAINHPWINRISDNLTEHVEWEGFHFHDMIFPLFLFIMGVTFPFSMSRRSGGQAGRAQLAMRVVWRSLALVFLGLIYAGLLQFKGLDHLRLPGVLQRLGIAWGIAALIALFTGFRGQIVALAVVLLSYWATMQFVPAPGMQPGNFTQDGNLANYIDRQIFLPGQLYVRYGDPEGPLSTIPAIGTALLGIFAGQWLRSKRTPMEKVRGLIVAGVLCIAVGNAWGFWFPVIKKLWTSSYVLVAGGWSMLLLAAFYWWIDVRGWRTGTFFWVVIGLNPITIYIGQRIIDFDYTAKFFVGGVANHFGIFSATVLAAGGLAVRWLFLYFLHRKRIYLKV